MKKEKRRISTEMKLIIGIVIAILTFVSSVYIYNNYFAGHGFSDDFLLYFAEVFVGLVLISITVVIFLAIFALIGALVFTNLEKYYAKKSYLKSKEQIKALPSNFVNVHFKDFDNFRLASFVDSEDITCFAKLDENGNVVYTLQLNVEYETDDYETFLEHFDI